jgi:hypothetical protein
MVWNSIPPRCPFDNKKCNESWSPKPKVNKDSFMLSCRYGSWDHTTVKPPCERVGKEPIHHTVPKKSTRVKKSAKKRIVGR